MLLDELPKRDLAVVDLVGIAGAMLQLSDLFVPAQFSGEFLQYAIVFFVLAIVAAAVGARDVAGISMEIARIFVSSSSSWP